MAMNRRGANGEDLESEVLDKLTNYINNGFPEAKRLHELIMQANPSLKPRLWYGMPGYAKTKDSAVLCFFRKDTLISFGFTESVAFSGVDSAAPSILPSAWYISKLDKEAEEQIVKSVTALT